MVQIGALAPLGYVEVGKLPSNLIFSPGRVRNRNHLITPGAQQFAHQHHRVRVVIDHQYLLLANLFRQGKPRALLEVKSPNIRTVIDEARLRGYDREKTRPSQVRKK